MKQSKSRKKIIAAIQARMGSRRLPQKVMRLIEGKTMIERIWERLNACKEIDEIVLATSTRKENDVLAEYVKRIGLACVRGSEEDLIQRHSAVLERYKGDALVRITADCPLVDPLVVDTLVGVYRQHTKSVDLVSNIFPRTYPKGLDTEVIPLHTFKRLEEEVKDPRYRELTTYYIMEHPQSFIIKNIEYKEDISQLRWTVDYPEDLEFVQKIYEALYTNNRIFTMEDILKFLTQHPEIAAINAKWAGKSNPL